MFEFLSDPAVWAGLATLTLMEIVLGIDNIIFISILAGKLPEEHQNRARFIGLGLAAVTRVLMLFGISWLVSLTAPFIELFGHSFSGRDLISAAVRNARPVHPHRRHIPRGWTGSRAFS